jgi:hypothetical protein
MDMSSINTCERDLDTSNNSYISSKITIEQTLYYCIQFIFPHNMLPKAIDSMPMINT